MSATPADSLTPMLRQYHAVKAQHPGAILMFRMGDFYEMFFDDALAASRALDITLTSRGKGTGNAAPMCGVPYHAADQYVARLVRGGFRVALCDQVEAPGPGKKLVRREVVRVVTPGTLTDPAQLDARAHAWIAAAAPPEVTGAGWGIAAADLSTGDFRLSDLPASSTPDEAAEALAAYSPREILHPEGHPPPRVAGTPAAQAAPLTERPAWTFSADGGRRAWCDRLGVATLAGFGLEGHDAAVAAAGALLGYLEETQKSVLAHVDRLILADRSQSLVMDQATRRNLELVRSLSDGSTRGTLLDIVDRTRTPMGARLLRERLLAPLLDREAIEERLDAVSRLTTDGPLRGALRERMGRVGDLERTLARAAVGTVTPRDLGSLAVSLSELPRLRASVASSAGRRAGGDALDALAEALPDLSALADLLAAALGDELPATARDGGFIRAGYDAAVDEARALSKDGTSTLAALESRERERTGIGSLKVRYNRIFGYYIEVSRAHLASVPADYERRQTLVGGERFVTPELRNWETKILSARERLVDREIEIFGILRAAVLDAASALREAARAVASLDVAAAFAETASVGAWVRPALHDGTAMRISGGRHPVVESLQPPGAFVPNDTVLDPAREQIALITGPNMGGKSTYLRQTALIVVLAQAGSFVPAAAVELGLVDRIFSRVGASDNLAGGQSTFMVEMTETANILHSATPRSLVLLDEVGRGTSTFDGLSLAWAIVEYLHDTAAVAARTLFATHYHELTEIALTRPRVVNLHIAAREHRGEVAFLHKIAPGAADQSYGIHVARLAGVPRGVIERAREVLETLEREEIRPNGTPRLAAPDEVLPGQLSLFGSTGAPKTPETPATHPAVEALRALEPDRMTPIDALAALAKLRDLIDH